MEHAIVHIALTVLLYVTLGVEERERERYYVNVSSPLGFLSSTNLTDAASVITSAMPTSEPQQKRTPVHDGTRQHTNRAYDSTLRDA